MEKAIYRIIDANFNRAREACRVMEEFCRFALNCEQLSSRAKQLRHELCTAVGKLNAVWLISARDTEGDVGVGVTVENQLRRTDIYSCFTAAAKRLPEALRALSETVATLEPELASKIESLRYRAYTLEKDITLFCNTSQKFNNVLLYVIVTSDHPTDVLAITQKCAKGGADCIQLRAKNMPGDAHFATASEFVKICRDAGVLSVINDRVDIAAACHADGVHLGQNDVPTKVVRQLELTPLITGKSTHSIKQLETACLENPTYVGIGPVFSTGTKPTEKPVGTDYVKEAVNYLKSRCIGHAAIGGITLDNIDEVLDAGARTVAICSAIIDAPDPTAACKEFKERILDKLD